MSDVISPYHGEQRGKTLIHNLAYPSCRLLSFVVCTAEIKALDDKVEALRSKLRDDITELRSQQKTTDARLWAFIVGLVTLVGGSVIKILWFDRA